MAASRGERRCARVRRQRADGFKHRQPAISTLPDRVVFNNKTAVYAERMFMWSLWRRVLALQGFVAGATPHNSGGCLSR